MKNSCDTCAKKDTCKRDTGIMFGFCNTDYQPRIDLSDLTPLQFLQNYYGCVDCSINYRSYEYGSHIVIMSMDEAVKAIERDIDEMFDFLCHFGIEGAAKEATFKIWEKHLVKF